MRKISKRVKNQILADPYYERCAREDEHCRGRITWEHAWMYEGSQIDEVWAIIPLCWYHHLGEGLNKEENQKIALSRATEEDLKKYPRKNWAQFKLRWNIA